MFLKHGDRYKKSCVCTVYAYTCVNIWVILCTCLATFRLQYIRRNLRSTIGYRWSQAKYCQGYYHSICRNPLLELSPQTPVSDYSWPHRTHVADEVVSPSCFRSSCRLVHSGSVHYVEYVVFELCNVSCPPVYSLLDNVDDAIYICLVPNPGNTFIVT